MIARAAISARRSWKCRTCYAPVFAGLSVLALAASGRSQEPPVRRLPVPPPPTADTVRADTAPAPGDTVQAAREPRPQAGQVVPVNWGRAMTDAREQFRRLRGSPVPRLTNATLRDTTRTRLPVLLPTVRSLDMGPSPPSAMLFPHENFYTASMSGNGLLVEVFGTRLVHAPATGEMRGVRRLMAADPDSFLVSRGEGGWDINFTRYGAAYTVTLECDNPRDDRCATDEQAREVARSLLIVGGSPGEDGVQ